MIAALFVEKDGCYFGLPDVDPWDEARDARKYAGQHAVVAHPPCQLWGPMANVNFARYGGEHNRPGNDGGCFASALQAVRRWGGVLEHPAGTRAWAAHGLTAPTIIGWQQSDDGWVCEVWQSAYGHRANKATWLYCSGVVPPRLRWNRPIGTHQIGQHDQRGKAANKPTVGKKEASATPREFRDVLLGIAQSAKTNPVVLSIKKSERDALSPRAMETLVEMVLTAAPMSHEFALAVLGRNFTHVAGVYRKNDPKYSPNWQERDALDYLCAEWDYGYENP